jgi:hypothetical protein
MIQKEKRVYINVSVNLMIKLNDLQAVMQCDYSDLSSVFYFLKSKTNSVEVTSRIKASGLNFTSSCTRESCK